MRPYLTLLLLAAIATACRHTTPAVSKKTSPDLEKARHFFGLRNDSAYYYFNRVVTSSRDNLEIARTYNQMAVIQAGEGDYFGAQESLSLSLRSLDEQNPAHRKCLASDYNELGMVSFNLKDYTAALAHYAQALRFSDIKALTAVIHNNQANAYQQKHDYPPALALYQQALAEGPRSGTDYARALANLALTRWMADHTYPAAPQLLLALHIRKNANDLWGLNSSYTHLADYYAETRPDSAVWYASAQYAVAQKLNSPDDELEALQKLIRFGSANVFKPYFKRFQQLSDSLQLTRSAAKNQFALIRYGVEKKNADNLRLQKENTETRYQLAGLAILAVAGTIGLGWGYRRRRQRLELATAAQIRENRLTDSKTIHDTVANDIYRIMKHIELDEAMDREWLLRNIADAYQRSRDISYEIVKAPEEAFHERIYELLSAFTTEDTDVIQVGNSSEFWQKFSAAQRFELRYVILELLVNMKKHSRATNVVFRFEDKGDHAEIHYFDNGIGMPDGIAPKNGLTNTGNRILAMRGEFTFVEGAAKGVHLLIAIPFERHDVF